MLLRARLRVPYDHLAGVVARDKRFAVTGEGEAPDPVFVRRQFAQRLLHDDVRRDGRRWIRNLFQSHRAALIFADEAVVQDDLTRFAGGQRGVPELHGAIVTRGDQRLAVGTEQEAIDRPGVSDQPPNRIGALAACRGQVPDQDIAASVGGRDFVVADERNGENHVAIPGERVDYFGVGECFVHSDLVDIGGRLVGGKPLAAGIDRNRWLAPFGSHTIPTIP